MSARVTLATALRVLRQLRRDPRTLALLFVVPPLLLTLFKYVFDGQPETFDRIGGPLVGIFPFVLMFVITSITMLRERTTGTLERLMTLPLSKLDLLAGYALASSPSAMPSNALPTASRTTTTIDPSTSSPSNPNATAAVTVAWTAATSPNASP